MIRKTMSSELATVINSKNPERLTEATHTEYANRGKTLQVRKNEWYYPQKMVEYFSDLYFTKNMLAYANVTSDAGVDTVLVHHDSDCEGFVENGYPVGVLIGQPARAFARQFWGEFLNTETPVDNGETCVTVSNVAMVREVQSGSVKLSGNHEIAKNGLKFSKVT